MQAIGDTSKFINTGLEEQDFSTYRCGVCGKEKEVAVNFDLHSRLFFPAWIKDAICCDELMDRIN